LKGDFMSGRDLETVRILRAIAHPARLQLLRVLCDGEECVCHLTALLGKRQAYVSQQLMFLREAGLVQDRKDSFRVYYRIKEPRVRKLLDAVNSISGGYHISVKELARVDCPCPKCQKQGGKSGGQNGPHGTS
jgi:DNA-binding transcriptional ArsR family regulator